MNIFVTDLSPVQSAINLDNRRLVKMVLESAQLLSTTLTVLGDDKAPYRVSHLNHPCSVWARSSRGNYQWLFDHFVALSFVYTQRYRKQHKCSEFISLFGDTTAQFPNEPLLPFVNCSLFKDETDVVQAYRKTMEAKWRDDKRPPAWHTEQQFPGWG